MEGGAGLSEPVGFIEHWAPAFVMLVSLGIWAGRLENVTSTLRRDQDDLKHRVENIDTIGTRAMSVEMQRVSAIELAMNSLENRLTELSNRIQQIDRSIIIMTERQGDMVRRLEIITDHFGMANGLSRHEK